MQTRRSIFFLALAAVFAIAAVFSARRWIEGQIPAPSDTDAATIPVVVSRVEIPVGVAITERQLETVQWPQRYVPKGVFREPNEAQDRVLRRPLSIGEPVLESSLLPKGATGGLISLISENKRAVSVKVDPVIGVAGFVTPGARVDVIATLRRIDQPNALPYSKVILQDIPVLAIDQKMEEAKSGEPEVVNVVTLEVDPEQAEKLLYGSHEGRLQLALRNPKDRELTATKSVSVADVLGNERRGALRSAPDAKYAVQVIKGSAISVRSF